MNELAIQQQRTVDRVAIIGSALAMLSAAAFVALDPIQTVARRPAAISQPAAPTAAVASSDTSPLLQIALPSPAWTVVSDGTWAAYARLEKGQPAEVVVRSLHSQESRVVFRAGTASYLGQLSIAKGVLALEEIAQPTSDGRARSVAIRAIAIGSGAITTIDTFAPTSSLASSPVTDGARVLWIRPAAPAGDEIREYDLATGDTRTVASGGHQLAGLSLYGKSIAYTALAGDAAQSYLLDLSTGTVNRVDGFAYSYVQSVAPGGVIVTGALASGAPAASWLAKTDGTRTRLGSECFNVTMTSRIVAMRCASQIEIRDLVTGSSLYRFAGNAGTISVFEGGVLWGEGDELILYELPSLANESYHRPH